MASLNRYALNLDDATLRMVERLQATYELKTKADAYDLALRVLSWVTEQRVKGYEFGRFKNGDFQPLLIPHNLKRAAWIESEQTEEAH